ncbi:MAG: cytochrome P450 [Acidobacteria bacterium]|nr:cytochrome P450 [Acidobacteriota bacterium]
MSKYDSVSAERVPAMARPVISVELPPGPQGVPVLGWNVEALRWSKDPVSYLARLYQEYGTLSVWNPQRPFRVFAFAPEHNQKILANPELFQVKPDRKGKDQAQSSAMMTLRTGLLRLDGEEHKQHRKLMAPAFHHKQVEAYAEMMAAMTHKMIDAWSLHEVRDIEDDLRRLVHRVAMKAVLSLDDESEIQTLNELIETMLSSAPRAFMLPFDLPGSSYRKMMKSANGIVAFLQALVERKRPNADACRDILAMMISARNEEGTGFDSAELIAEAYNALCHESSASTLVWTLFLLAQHPQVYEDLVEELSSELRGGNPGIEQLSRLPLLDRVLKESMRLIPTAPFGTRFNVEPCQMGAYELPKNAAVTFSQFITHRLPEIYERPKCFLPERWETYKPTPYEYFPFGAGRHNCIGAAFAMLEMKMVLAILLQRYRVAVPPNLRIDHIFQLSLRPRKGLLMSVAATDSRCARSPVTGNVHALVELG